MKTTLKKAALFSATSLTAFAALASTGAHAQVGDGEAEAAAEPAGAIVVTGSRIARPDLESAAPLSVVSSEEFALSGATNVENVINTLPQVVPGLTGFSNNPGNGAVTLNLRGLGSTRTLVLVNGRRWMFYDTTQVVDLNTIPQFLIKNVDVVTGGASAVYGSDALAGVVNFKLDDNLNGLLLNAQSNITERGDGFRYNLDFALGSDIADGRGHITVWGSYNKRESIYQSARSFSRNAAVDGCVVPGSVSKSTGLGTEGDYDDDGNCTGGSVAGPVAGGSSYIPSGRLDVLGGMFTPTGGDLTGFEYYNYAPANYLMLPQERYMFGGYGDYEINDSMTAYAEVSYVHSVVPQELAATPAYGTAEIDVDSPYFSSSVQQQLAALDTDGDGYVSSFYRRRMLEIGSRNSNDERNAFRVMGGLKGDIAPGWTYDAYYMYSRTRNSQVQTGNVSYSRMLQAIKTDYDADGNLVCYDQSNGCVPINIFGQGTISDEAAQFVAIGAQNTEISSLQVASASVSGSLFDLPGGSAGIAFGAEYRKVGAEYIPDTALASGDVLGFNAGEPTSGSYNVKELFAELYLPIISGGAIDRFEVTAAGRYSDYSLDNVGGVWTYAVGANLAPIKDITFRAQYQRAVRAPNVDELFGGNSQGFPSATDPCSDRNTSQRTDAVRDLCIATGVDSADVFGSEIQLNSQIQGTFGGNADLEEETSDSWTAGVVLQPSFIPRLSITADYFSIKVDNLISTLGGGLNNTLALCYYTVQDINSDYCQAITRGSSGSITDVQVLSANVSSLETSGIDLQLDYRLPLNVSLFGEGGSDLSFFFLGTWTEKNNLTPVAQDKSTVYKCAGYYGNTCGTPQPKYKFTTRLSWVDGPQTISIRGRYLSKVKDDAFSGASPDPDTVAVDSLAAKFYTDLTLSWDVMEDRTLTFGINNMFDVQPPLTADSQEQANTYPSVYDVLGREFFISFRAKL